MKVFYHYLMKMIINQSIHSGILWVFYRCFTPVQKVIFSLCLNLSSLSRGAKGVRRGRRKITAKIISRGHLLLGYFNEYIYVA